MGLGKMELDGKNRRPGDPQSYSGLSGEDKNLLGPI
jgi:hypothetical protein